MGLGDAWEGSIPQLLFSLPRSLTLTLTPLLSLSLPEEEGNTWCSFGHLHEHRLTHNAQRMRDLSSRSGPLLRLEAGDPDASSTDTLQALSLACWWPPSPHAFVPL